MNPATLSIITATFPPKQRGQAIGIWAGVSALALAIGPLVGGLIVDNIGWNWIFFVNVPIGVLGIVVSLLVIKESRDTSHEQSIDLPGPAHLRARPLLAQLRADRGQPEGLGVGRDPRTVRGRSRVPRGVHRAREASAAADARSLALQDPLVRRSERRRAARLARDVRRLLLRLALCPERPRVLADEVRRDLPADDDPDHPDRPDRREALRPDRRPLADGWRHGDTRRLAAALPADRPALDLLDAPALADPRRDRDGDDHVADDLGRHGLGAGRQGRRRVGRAEQLPPDRRRPRDRRDGRDPRVVRRGAGDRSPGSSSSSTASTPRCSSAPASPSPPRSSRSCSSG